MLQYWETHDAKLLICSDTQIDKVNLNVIVINILSWLKLENKRSLWIAQGRKTCLKPLELNSNYPWCRDLCMLVEKEKLFQNTFSINGGKLYFSDAIPENDRIAAREMAYRNYNPPKIT